MHQVRFLLSPVLCLQCTNTFCKMLIWSFLNDPIKVTSAVTVNREQPSANHMALKSLCVPELIYEEPQPQWQCKHEPSEPSRLCSLFVCVVVHTVMTVIKAWRDRHWGLHTFDRFFFLLPPVFRVHGAINGMGSSGLTSILSVNSFMPNKNQQANMCMHAKARYL